MVRLRITYRTLAALILLGIMAAIFVSLGNWQLRRADQRQATQHAIQAGRASPPLHLTAKTSAHEFINWRPATVNGTWINSLTVLLQNRNLNGRPGYWVATPLLIDPGTNSAVLVLRGWFARPVVPDAKLPDLSLPDAAQTVQGELIDRVPRLFELWSSDQSTGRLPATLPDPEQTLPQVQNLDLDAYARATGLDILPVVLEQTSDNHDKLDRQWPGPPIDADTNLGYAMQWFAFAGIATLAWLAIAWRILRRRRQTI